MPKPVDVTTPSDREIVVVRTFDAPAQMVFDCHTKPELVVRWMLGPPGWSMPVCEIDLRVGGRYRYVWRNDANAAEQFGATGEFKQIEAPRKLVHSEAMEGFDGESLCTHDFVEAGGVTTLTATMLFKDKASRDGALASGMSNGMAQSYDRIDGLIEEGVV